MTEYEEDVKNIWEGFVSKLSTNFDNYAETNALKE